MADSHERAERIPDRMAMLLRLLVDGLFVVIFFMKIYRRGIPAERLAGLEGRLHIPVSQLFLAGLVLAGILALLAVYAVHTLLHRESARIVRRICSNRIAGGALRFAVVLFVLSGLYWSLEISTFGFVVPFLHVSAAALICSISLLLVAELVLVLLLGNTKRSLTALSVLVMLWSIANYFTVLYHGSPLIFSEFLNFKTAMAVAGAYSYKITREILIVVFLSMVGILAADTAGPALVGERGRLKSVLYALLMLLATGAMLCWLFPLVVSDIFPWMPWNRIVINKGLLVYSVEDLQRRSSEPVKPEGYDASNLPEAVPADASVPGREYPDIILILNETFSDLNVYSDITTDQPALEAFYSIPGLVRGFAAVPKIGGGTSDSEFEMLLSKSEYLLTQGAPFTWIGEEQLSRSVVGYLQRLGYETTGMHIFGSNYNRNKAYPAMGFDHVLLGNGFPNSEGAAYGSRIYPDAPLYEDLKQQALETDQAKPQFYYLLTFQNHGGYELNDASLDTVHVLDDLGDLTDDVNEYLSSLRISADSFHSLIDYYAGSERKTIICMVGDHLPPFLCKAFLQKTRT